MFFNQLGFALNGQRADLVDVGSVVDCAFGEVFVEGDVFFVQLRRGDQHKYLKSSINPRLAVGALPARPESFDAKLAKFHHGTVLTAWVSALNRKDGLDV